MKVYHQIGHNFSWNRDSFSAGIGDGLILGPRYMDRTSVEQLTPETKSRSIFDPQFFNPHEAMGDLTSYPFFPANALEDEFSTTNFENSQYSLETARQCISFQLDNSFEYTVIPSRHYTGVPDDFSQLQASQFTDSFITELRRQDMGAKSILQLVLNEDMLASQNFVNNLLNWVTGIYDIAGVYIILERKKIPKQLANFTTLSNMLKLIRVLKDNGFYVIVGYCNTEALLYSIANPDVVTMGSYENTRMFGMDAFKPKDGEIRSPNARIYVPQLFQWIDVGYVGAIQQIAAKNDEFFGINGYREEFFGQPRNKKWHFQNPLLYKHFFYEFSKQVSEISSYHEDERYRFLYSKLVTAQSLFQEFDNKGIILGKESDGNHIEMWMTVANSFASEAGWR